MNMIDFLPLISGAIGGAASVGAFKGPIKTLEDLWYINYGYPATEKAAKLRELQELNVKMYADNIAEEMSKIKPDKVHEPALNIMGPALEASKYYIGTEEMRNMFSKLLASSMNEEKDLVLHNSFVEIIKQLSSVDAENLDIMNKSNTAPVAEIRVSNIAHSGYQTIHNNFFPTNSKTSDTQVVSASLDNLKRLGLISISYDKSIIPKDGVDPYYDIENAPFLQMLNTAFEQAKKIGIDKIPWLEQYQNFDKAYAAKGIIELTQFGKNFCSTCIS
ncbi:MULTISPECIES: DUF4393 domain-containing protein [Lactococcus]|uniref:DUF4393 domain-containing protein n=1 Tax=Lactococcus TaxID=1357 RepID=UPI001CE27D76|nr:MULTISPECIES: DUF4393 domain-containing protein [Lactococcus]MCG3096955.1 DUF4393 domain-containing protein [Lactococcus petauri]